MLFEVSVYTLEGDRVVTKPINWIKDFRETYNVGLKHSKELCDYVRMQFNRGNLTVNGKVAVDTDSRECIHLKFLEEAIVYNNNGKMLRMVNFDISHRTLSQAQYAAAVASKQLDVKKPTSDDVLKNTAIRLIRMNAIDRAAQVLKILM